MPEIQKRENNNVKQKNEIRENLLMNKSIHDTQWGASGKEKDFHRLYI